MATILSASIDVFFTPQNSDTKKHNPFSKPSSLRQSITRKLNISCNSLKQPKTLKEEEESITTTKTKSLSDQLKPLSATILRQEQTNVLSKPKSVWVNPTTPKSFDFTVMSQFLSLLQEIPHPPNRDNALLVLNGLRQWQKTHMFFDWVKGKRLFPIETIFYNVAMKSLEMVNDGVELDNITYSTIITCAKQSY
ncbi:unnamed protein product [Cochlearia groenlandica]